MSDLRAGQGHEPPKPLLVAVDLVLFVFSEGELRLLLVKRKHPPFAGAWALPGGFVEESESLAAAAVRELAEETGVEDVYVEQLYTFGEPGRDPRGRVITVAHLALANAERVGQAAARDETSEVGWFNVYDLPALAFDHDRIIAYALQRLRAVLEHTALGFLLLTTPFTLSDVQALYEVALQEELDKRNFRRKILAQGILEKTGQKRYGDHRPAALYRFTAAGIELEKARRRSP